MAGRIPVLGIARSRSIRTAVGYNKKKKGQRSYYPLFCTVAQTGQVLDVWHRAGNVHDSNGARAFILVNGGQEPPDSGVGPRF